MNLSELRSLLYSEIPMSSAMEVEVTEESETSITLKAPLSVNRNHLDTAFGGSLSTLLILSCYAWLFQRMNQEGFSCHVLIQEGHTDFILPVKEDLKAICYAPDRKSFEKFLESFRRKGVGRMTLKAEIITSSGKACDFHGVFIAQMAK